MLKIHQIIFLVEMFFICLIVSYALNSVIINYAKKCGILLDKDSIAKPQKMHYGDIPRAGGIGIIVALSIGVIFGLKYGFLLLLVPIFLVFLSGILEDFHNSLSPKKRLLLQVLGSISAIYIFDCVILDIGFSLPYYFGVAFSIFCIVGVINALNIIDGFNGLSSGFSILVFLSIALVSYTINDLAIFYICIVALGAIGGFFILNFPKGKIFLGDGGAYLLGFLIAFLLIMLTQGGNLGKVSPWYGVCIMIYPIFEVLFSIYRKKILRNMSPTEPDSVHFHMLIYKRITRSNYKTSMLIWLFNMPFIIFGTIFFDDIYVLLTLIVVFIGIYLFIYFSIIKFRNLKLT